MPETVARQQPSKRDAAQESVFLRACRGQAVERTPVWIMRQAGRYLPEYRAVRDRYEFLTCCQTPELACEITLQPVRRLGVDAAILFSDILIPLPGMGIDVRFEPGPRLSRASRTAPEVHALRVPDARESTPFVFEAIRLIRRELPAGVPLIGFAGAPFTMAAYMVEGGGSKTFAGLRALMFSDPATMHRLLDVCTMTVVSYLTEQVRAGVHAAMLFDTWAGLLSPGDVRQFALPYAKRVTEAVRAAADDADVDVPTIYYAGESAGWIETSVESGADVLGIDWRIALNAARARLGPGVVLQGNLDPAVLLGPPAIIRERAREVVDAARRGRPGQRGSIGHVFNLGHGILPETPPDHARLLVETVRELSGGGE